MFKNIILPALLFAFLSCTSQKSKNVTVLNFKDFKEQVIGKDVQLVDLRTNEEFKEGFIDDAVQMNFFETETFSKQIEALDKNKPVYVYCHSGGRSGKASKLLIEKGFSKVYDFSGGYKAWKENNN